MFNLFLLAFLFSGMLKFFGRFANFGTILQTYTHSLTHSLSHTIPGDFVVCSHILKNALCLNDRECRVTTAQGLSISEDLSV